MDGSQLFIVRIWSERADFRASVRAVDREETKVFAEPVELLHFLCGPGVKRTSIPSQPSDEGTT